MQVITIYSNIGDEQLLNRQHIFFPNNLPIGTLFHEIILNYLPISNLIQNLAIFM